MKDKKLTQIIFGLVKASLTEYSLIITPNMLRFVALQLLKNNENHLHIKISNIIFESMNRGRIITRTLASTMLGIVAVTIVTIPYAILTGLVYFELLPREGPIVMEE